MNKLIIFLAVSFTLVAASQYDFDRALDEFKSQGIGETSWIRNPSRSHRRSSSKMKRSSLFSRQMRKRKSITQFIQYL